MEAAEGIAQDAVLPEAMAPPQQMRRDRNVNRLTLSDVIGSAEGPGGILFNWIPSRGDVERLRATSKAMRFAIDCAPQATVPQYRYLGLFRPSRGLEPLSALEPHQLGSLRHMAAAESPPGWRFGELRGGILADDPGLGKTVTMMALVVASAGATPRTPDEFWDRAAIREGWQSLRVNRVAKQQLTPLLNRIEGAGVVLPGGHSFLVDPAPLPTTFPTLESFEDDVWAAVNRVSSVEAMGALNDYARKALNAMRRGLDRKQRSYFATNVGRRALLERELRPVGATLIVVPTPLLEHWAEQFRRHVDLDAISRSPDGSGRLAVWIDGVGDLADLPVPFPSAAAHGAVAATSAAELARYVVVVTTFDRCRREFERADTRTAAAWQGRSDAAWAADDSRRSPYMAIRWLRLVVDEGHALGGGDVMDEADEQANTFIAQLAAERRWVLSGTPTVGRSVGDALGQMHNLLRFLREPTYGLTKHAEWARKVATPFAQGEAPGGHGRAARGGVTFAAARAELLSVLRPIMVRHTKKDLQLPEPIVLPEWNGTLALPEGAHWLRGHGPPRLLFPTKAAEKLWVSAVFRNAAQYIVSSLAAARRDARADGANARQVKAVVFSRYINDLEQVGSHLYESEGDGCVAQHFGSLRSTELSRFRNGRTRYRCCPRCGFDNEETSLGDRCSKPLIEVCFDEDAPGDLGGGGEFARTWPVEEERVMVRDPTNLTGWRPWRAQDFYRWAAMTPAEKRVKVLGDLVVPGSNLPRPGGGNHICELKGFGKCGSYFGPPRLMARPRYEGCPPCWLQHGTHYTAAPVLRGEPWHVKELDTYLLLLCEDGTHGLDLSFVTHIFLVHRLADPSLMSQVVARAHRMGCDKHKGVTVQTLHLFDEVEG